MTSGNSSAYPNTDAAGFVSEGLTKRELFAAMAMQGHCCNEDLSNTSMEIIASMSVEQADALLAELAKEPAV